jgi:aminotransferase EvaB
MSYVVPFVNPREHYRKYKDEFDAAITSCLSKGDLIARQQLRDFEAKLAHYVGTQYAVGLNSGYHALALSLVAAGVSSGDEVITVAHTFVATVSAIIHCGATPVFVDITNDYNMDVDSLERAITSRTRLVLPVHLNGRISNMGAIMALAKKHGLLVIEDACQALGASYQGKKSGSWGISGCWSFYPFKILGCFGDGGAITSNDNEIARNVSLLRFNGEDRETGEYHCHGYTALLDNIQAALLDVKLGHFESWVSHRRAMAELYRLRLEGVGDLRLPHFPGDQYYDVYQNYVIRTHRRDELRKFLKIAGIETLVSWPKPMWKHPGLKLGDWKLPETEAICREVISLPMSAEITPEQVVIVSDEIKRFFAQR